jgi:hypothetical protein
VIANSSRPEQLLKKKANAIAYHAVREACAMKAILLCYVPADDKVVYRKNINIEWLRGLPRFPKV